MFARASALGLTEDQRAEIESLVRSGSTPQRIASKGRLILLAQQGLANHAIAKQLSVSRPTVLGIRSAFSLRGIDAIWLHTEVGNTQEAKKEVAVVLEDEKEVLKWFKPAKDQVRIYYSADNSYEPDFIVETETEKLMCEPKRASELGDEVVQAKARAAMTWCGYATEHARTYGGKAWSYLLIPHDAITASSSLNGLAASYLLAGSI